MDSFSRGIDQLQKLLDLGTQYWFLGAGASVGAKIPLMAPLTARVRACLEGESLELFNAIWSDLPDSAHVEHLLSQVGDLIAVAARSKSGQARLQEKLVSTAELKGLHEEIVSVIASTVRYGYCPSLGDSPEEIGTLTNPIVDVQLHRNFVRQVFERRSNLEGRSNVAFFTVNYDTLIEDALALERRVAIDGFSGGGFGFWNEASANPAESKDATSHHVVKLHGSVDWFHDEQCGLVRVRYGVRYLADLKRTLIFPQATKYVETQKDPFARQFSRLRRALAATQNHVLCVVGYSFGDEHINSEIEAALRRKGSQTNLVVFTKEVTATAGEAVTSLSPILETWRQAKEFGDRVLIASDKRLYCGAKQLSPGNGNGLDWWTFSGLIRFLEKGDSH